MKITEAAVKHPITTIMMFLALFILGLVSLSMLGLELFPNVTYPTVMVVTVYPGVGPYEIESSVTDPIEDAVSSMNGIKEVSSTSSEGVSMVTLNFDWGKDLETIVVDVREKLNDVESDLPEGIDRPSIYKFNPEQLPSLIFNLSTKTTGIDTRQLAEEMIIPRLEKIEGVAQAAVYGGKEKAVMCRLDLDSLSKLGIPITRILNVFQGENINLPAGSISLDNRYMILRTVGEFESIEDIGLVLVGYKENVPVFLRDVADITFDYLPQEEFVRAFENRGVMVSIRKQPGHNTVQINEEVRKRLRELEADLPPSVTVRVQSDQSQTIVQSIGGVANAAWQGGILAIFVLLFFLRSIRSTLIISVVIPVSLIATFSLMNFAGLSLNIISLMGITLGVGMFVDNAIVVLEAAFRNQLAGLSPREAAIKGTAEVGKAITASTLTTVSVFVPMIFVRGIAGLIFDDLAMTISFALIISLAAGLTLVPALCARFLKVEGRVKAKNGMKDMSLADLEIQTGSHKLDGVGRRIQKGLYRLDAGYQKLIMWALRHARLVVVFAVLLLIGSIGSILLLGMEFLPEADEGEFTVSVETKIGSTFEYTEEKVIQIENIILDNFGEDVTSLSSKIGESGGTGVAGSIGSNFAVVYVKLKEKDKRDRGIWDILSMLETKLDNNVMDVRYRLQVEGMAALATVATGDPAPVVIELSGSNLDALYSYARKTGDVMESLKGARNVEISHKTGKPELQFIVKRREAISLGLTPLEIAATLRTAYKGTEVTSFNTDEGDYSVVIVLEEEDRNDPDKFGSIFFVNQGGAKIPLENLVDIEEGKGPLSIKHKKRARMIKISASLTGEVPLNRIMGELENRMGDLGPPPVGVEMEYSGSGNEMGESFSSMMIALLFAVVLVYMVMASQFESLLHPFIVMFSIPFAIIGLVLAHLLTGTTFSLMSFVGAILLVGIVVNNAIVLIDYMNQLQKRGMSLVGAIIKGGKTRLKPILMTTLTTLLALLPMSLGIGTGAELRAPMGRAVVGGLATSTLITLILIPTVYYFFESRVKKRLQRRRAVQEPDNMYQEVSEYD
jgi:hydrophobic/amphiphilic exporter-1 (mainly G- bacteria), HAE1 family